MSFFTDILRDVQNGLRNEIPDQLAPPPQGPGGFEYDPNYEGEYVDMATQPIEPPPQRTVQSTPDYYGNTIPIDAYENGVNPDRGVRSFTNIPGRGDGYELIEEATPAGTKSVYDTIGPIAISEDATPEEQARIRWETNKQYEEARDVQGRQAAGLQNEVQADLLLRATGKLSRKERLAEGVADRKQASIEIQADFISSQMDTIIKQLAIAIPGTDNYTDLQAKMVSLDKKFKALFSEDETIVKKEDPLAKLRRELQKTLIGRTRLTKSNRTPEFIPESRDPRDFPPPGLESEMAGPFIGRYGDDLFDPKRGRPSIYSLRGRESF